MTNKEKLELLDNMLICYVDRTNLTNKQIEESEEFIENLRETILVTRCCETLPTDEEIYSEGCNYVRKIEQPNRQPLITLRRTFKAGAEFVKKKLNK